MRHDSFTYTVRDVHTNTQPQQWNFQVRCTLLLKDVTKVVPVQCCIDVHSLSECRFSRAAKLSMALAVGIACVYLAHQNRGLHG